MGRPLSVSTSCPVPPVQAADESCESTVGGTADSAVKTIGGSGLATPPDYASEPPPV